MAAGKMTFILKSEDQIKKMRWTEHVALLGDRIDADRAAMERPQGKRPLGKPRRRGQNNS